jgi:hypothetical protein
MNKNEDNTPNRFELTLNGKTRSFKTGYDMWKWAVQTNTKLDFPKEDAAPSRSKSNKQN